MIKTYPSSSQLKIYFENFRLWAEVFHVTTSGSGTVKWQQVKTLCYYIEIEKYSILSYNKRKALLAPPRGCQ